MQGLLRLIFGDNLQRSDSRKNIINQKKSSGSSKNIHVVILRGGAGREKA